MKGMTHKGDTSDNARMSRQGHGAHDTVLGEKGMPWSGAPGNARMARQGDGAMDTMVKCSGKGANAQSGKKM